MVFCERPPERFDHHVPPFCMVTAVWLHRVNRSFGSVNCWFPCQQRGKARYVPLKGLGTKQTCFTKPHSSGRAGRVPTHGFFILSTTAKDGCMAPSSGAVCIVHNCYVFLLLCNMMTDHLGVKNLPIFFGLLSAITSDKPKTKRLH